VTNEYALTVRREIAAPAEDLFDAWLDARRLELWLRPSQIRETRAETDPRVGGAFRIVMVGDASSAVHTGTYLEIDRPRRLVFTWSSAATAFRDSIAMPAVTDRATTPSASDGRATEATSRRTVTLAAGATTVGLGVAAWVVAIGQMRGMDMGPATGLGPLSFFVAAWVPMMAAMMLPGAVPAVSRHARAVLRLQAVPLFLGLYLAVWAAVGLAVYVVYRPHGTLAAGAVTIAAGLYELTPFKMRARRRCQQSVRSGFGFGLSCVGSSLGLMAMFVAIGVMSMKWMAVVAALVAAQKLLPPKTVLDVPLALAIVGLGTLIDVAPSMVPGLTGSI
jgi:uncharacterized protein YndB with AHSA1/START domain